MKTSQKYVRTRAFDLELLVYYESSSRSRESLLYTWLKRPKNEALMTGMYEQYYVVSRGEEYTPIKQAAQNGFHTSGALKLEELCPSGW